MNDLEVIHSAFSAINNTYGDVTVSVDETALVTALIAAAPTDYNLELSTAPFNPKFSVALYFISSHEGKTDSRNPFIVHLCQNFYISQETLQ